MIQIQLSREHADVLVKVLDDVLSDLSYEIANTDSQDYRDMLKRRREALQQVIRSVRDWTAEKTVT